MSIADAPQRAEALDVLSSFCVTAPAGSGKTELLIQRYLALLARVQRPEQVLAITFTRKAAAEMRERVLQALREAGDGVPCLSEHQRVTRSLAEEALARAAAADWQLSRDISRLNIKTIDSFCAGLTRQMPVLSGLGGPVQAVDDATPLYAEAVAELFTVLDSDRPEAGDLSSLLLHFDNDWERLSELLTGMLAKRDQWNDYMGARRSREEAERRLHDTVAAVIGEQLGDLRSLLSEWEDQILDLLCYARGTLGEPVPDRFPDATARDRELWQGITRLFLTQKGEFRKSITVREGFPAGKGPAQDYKEHWKNLASRLASVPGLEQELAAVSWLPAMDDHAEAWTLVVHLSHVLPLLAACLLLVFERRGAVDHAQVALAALDALGEDDEPTELALRLDYSIEHILVDEFQDTAINQYNLVSRLTRGWGQHNALNPEAPRTVFIVGDGMQSIYGFRNANVGLFLKARQEGFNGVIPKLVELRCNFRSQAGVVEWVNETFRTAFPAQDNVRRGRVSFTEAVAVRGAGRSPAVALHGFCGEDANRQEARWIVDQLREGLQDESMASIALLGRSRGQLAPVLQLLRTEGIPYASQDMDPLAGSPAIADLLSLCRALANPADRVAWYGLMRAPWLGLALADLYLLSRRGGAQQNVPALIQDGAWPSGLSAHARAALERLQRCLRWLEQRRERLALRVWVEQAWLALGGPESLGAPRHLRDVQRFMVLLQEADEAGVGLDMGWLDQRLQRLFSAGDDPDSKIQVMTLHKAKGLEFDWVFIPALARSTRGDQRDIMLWDEYNSPGGERGFLLAADDHSDERSPTLYNYLKRQRKEKSRLESTRLLYVGTTRAARRLTLTASFKVDGDSEPGEPVAIKDPPAGSLLQPIWTSFRRDMCLHPPASIDPPGAAHPPLRRVTGLAAPPLAPVPAASEGGNRPRRADNRVERFVGTVIHEQLERLSTLPELPATTTPECRDGARLRLLELGLWGQELEQALSRVLDALQRTLGDEEGGRWLLNPRHEQAGSELPLTIVRDGLIQDIVVDRCFVDTGSGVRWVVDYKSSTPAPGIELSRFLNEESERYREQLQTYRDALRALGPQPVRCALYFTGLGLLQHLPELDL